jgi:hypothetical protein
MAQAVSRRNLIVESPARARVGPQGICSGQSVIFCYPLSVPLHCGSPYSYIWGMSNWHVDGRSSET